MHVEILSVGAELISGAQTDTNSAWLSAEFLRCGVPTRRHTTVGDAQTEIAAAVREAAARADLVVVTGGLGPTADDLTREALADAAGVGLALDEASWEAIEGFFARLGRSASKSNRKQAMMPDGALPLANEWGTAPGVRIRLGSAEVFALPGVPREMKAMFAAYVVPFVEATAGRPTVAQRVLRTFGEGESNLAERLESLMAPGRNPQVGTTASGGVIAVRIEARAADGAAAQGLADDDAAEVRRRLGRLVYGEDEDTLADAVVRALVERRATLATAESCTGGLIGKYITDVSGSSAGYVGGLVTYSNAQKTAALGVPPALIEAEGAVSEAVARAMAEGCRAAVGSDYAVSVTGVAGPTGGTPAKPVGLVHLAVAGPEGTAHRACQFAEGLGRAVIRDRAAKTALNMLRLVLAGELA